MPATRHGAAALLAASLGFVATASAGVAGRSSEPRAPAGVTPAYRATAALSVNERLPEITGECRSTGSRRIEWRASVARLPAPRGAGRMALLTLTPGQAAFETFEARVASPCPGAFTNRFSGIPFRLAITWDSAENRFRVSTATEGLDEGEGAGWTHKGCTPGGRTSETLDLGGPPHYTTAETGLTAAEQRALAEVRPLTVRRAIDRTYPSAACGFGGDHFRVIATLEVVLTPLARPAGGGSGEGCTMTGTPRDDVLVGTRWRDVICGGAGDDLIRGLGGNDVIRAGAGGDRVFGQSGNDVVDGGAGPDRLAGDAGNDDLRARDRRRDTVRGGPGRDAASVDRGLDRVSGVERVR